MSNIIQQKSQKKLQHELQTKLLEYQPHGMQKLQAKLEQTEILDQKQFFYAFAICSRWFESSPVNTQASPLLSEADSFKIVDQWHWPHLARLYLLFYLAEKNPADNYVQLVQQLFHNSDVNESIVLIQSLAFIPLASAFVENAREAARSNIASLFSVVAHQSRYAHDYFDDGGWNQLILKAAFLAQPIWNIYGLHKRNNRLLVTMLKDYARERQAASRVVPWDLWCCVAWLASKDELEYLQTQHDDGDTQTQAAIGLALTENELNEAQQLGQSLLAEHPILGVVDTDIHWELIAEVC